MYLVSSFGPTHPLLCDLSYEAQCNGPATDMINLVITELQLGIEDLI